MFIAAAAIIQKIRMGIEIASVYAFQRIKPSNINDHKYR